MPEGMSTHFDKVVGEPTEEQVLSAKTRELNLLKELFKVESGSDSKQDLREILKDIEVVKSSEQIELIKTVIDKVNQFCEHLGLQRKDLSSDSVHLIKEDIFPPQFPFESVRGFMLPVEGQIYLSEKNSFLSALHILIHETIHLFSFIAMQKTIPRGGQELFAPYKVGIEASERYSDEDEEPETYFHELNEGLTETLTKRLFDEICQGVYFSGNKDYDQKEQYSVYSEQCLAVSRLTDKLFEHSNKFRDREEVLELMFKAMFKGNSFGLMKAIDETFGPKTSRWLGKADADRILDRVNGLAI